MQKKYVKPVTELLGVNVSTSILTSSDSDSPGVEIDPNNPNIPQSNSTRGEWGNVWNK